MALASETRTRCRSRSSRSRMLCSVNRLSFSSLHGAHAGGSASALESTVARVDRSRGTRSGRHRVREGRIDVRHGRLLIRVHRGGSAVGDGERWTPLRSRAGRVGCARWGATGWGEAVRDERRRVRSEGTVSKSRWDPVVLGSLEGRLQGFSARLKGPMQWAKSSSRAPILCPLSPAFRLPTTAPARSPLRPQASSQKSHCTEAYFPHPLESWKMSHTVWGARVSSDAATKAESVESSFTSRE